MLSDVRKQKLHEEGSLLRIRNPQDGAFLAGRRVISAVGKSITDVQHLKANTSSICVVILSQMSPSRAANKARSTSGLIQILSKYNEAVRTGTEPHQTTRIQTK
eukprot:scaffold155916_cov31-Prasinocladus_malaysianus.AAC.4